MGGVDKSRLRVGGRTILERQVAVLRTIVDRTLLVGARGADPLPHGVETVADRIYGCGPLGGLDAALAALEDRMLLIACDLPNVNPHFLAYLLSLTSDAEMVVPRTERGYHPLCAAYTPACHPVVRRRLDHGQLRMTDLMGELRVRVVEPDEIAEFGSGDELLANVNTQADLDAVETLLSH